MKKKLLLTLAGLIVLATGAYHWSGFATSELAPEDMLEDSELVFAEEESDSQEEEVLELLNFDDFRTTTVLVREVSETGSLVGFDLDDSSKSYIVVGN